jgi:hypothetical protein
LFPETKVAPVPLKINQEALTLPVLLPPLGEQRRD